MASEQLTEKVRRLRVRHLFEARPSDEQAENGILIFFLLAKNDGTRTRGLCRDSSKRNDDSK